MYALYIVIFIPFSPAITLIFFVTFIIVISFSSFNHQCQRWWVFLINFVIFLV